VTSALDMTATQLLPACLSVVCIVPMIFGGRSDFMHYKYGIKNAEYIIFTVDVLDIRLYW